MRQRRVWKDALAKGIGCEVPMAGKNVFWDLNEVQYAAK